MSGFIDSEASVTSDEDGEVVSRHKHKEETPVSSDSEEEEELPDEDEICRKEGKGWIVNDDEEAEESDEESNASEKSLKEDPADDDSLDDDDYDLINDNIGINIQRKTKKRRLIRDDDDEIDLTSKKTNKEVHSREAIARQIFEDEGNNYEDTFDKEKGPARAAPAFETKTDDEGEESDGMGDFIVDDNANAAQAARQKRQVVHKDPALQQAQDIFGVDFDFEEFEQFEEAGSDMSSGSDYEDDEEDAVLSRRRKNKRAAKAASHDRVYDLFDPTDLARAFYSPEDEQIRCTDIPERFQLRTVPVRRLDPTSTTYESDLLEVEKESEWIYNVAFREGPSKKPTGVTDKIFQVLKLQKESMSEVPFIAFYRKECIEKDLNINDLWRIFEYDEKWEILCQRRKGLIHQLERMRNYLQSIPIDEIDSNLKQQCDGLINLIALARNAASVEEVHDVRLSYLLHYAGFTEAMLQFEGKETKLAPREGSKSPDPKKLSDENDEEEDEDDDDYDPAAELKALSVEAAEAEGGTVPSTDIKAEVEVSKLPSPPSKPNALLKPDTFGITTTVDPLTGRRIRQRQVRTTAAFEVAQRAGIDGLVRRFGLTAVQFADNVRDQYMRHEVDQCPMLPLDAAADFICPQFADSPTALCAARYMLAFQISREPVVRQLARRLISSQTVISLSPTPNGCKIIDEGHPLFGVKFLKNKPILDLMGDVLYLHIHNAVRDKLMIMRVHMPETQLRGLCLIDDLKPFFHQNEFSALVQAWNDQRSLLLQEAIDQFLQPHLFKELQEKLLESSQQAVMKLCAQKLFKCLKVAPYVVDDHRAGGGGDGDDDSSDGERGGDRHRHHRNHQSSSGGGGSNNRRTTDSVWPKPARVVALTLKEDTEVMNSFVAAVQLDVEGEVVDFLHLPGLLYTGRSNREDLKKQREDDVRRLTQFLTRARPQAIVIGCNSRKALSLKDELQRIVDDLSAESRITHLTVEMMDTELAVVYAQSLQASSTLPSSYSPLLKQAISLGRRLQDPLSEFAQLFNADADVLGIRWHSAQDSVPKDLLLKALEIEFINRTNEVGVDINRCLLHPHTSNLLQFVAGLGPRKALHMMKILKQKKIYLTNREQLAKILKLGPHVAINCAGFMKIDTMSARELGGDNIEILDSMRVHPESYDLARQMAVDALEYDDADDNDPTTALGEIVQSPARLRELDLDAFAEELKRQGHGDKHITLYDIRKELNHRYRDLRIPFEPLTPEQIFSLTTNETPETLHVGRLVDCQVINVATRKPKPDQLDQANPTKNEATGLWRCPFCKQDDFQQLNEMWAHFDSNECPGQPVGLRVQLENGISGFIPLRFTDPPIEKVLEQAQPGTILQARVMKIDITKYQVELTLKASDLQDERHLWTSRKDPFFNYEAEEAELKREEVEMEKEKTNASQAYINRVIFHPHFKNISYNQLAAMEPTLETGTIIIRPSRQGTDHLTVSLKVDDGILKHFDVTEKDKTHSFALGRVLLIGQEEFEDLDEIVARYMQPMVYLIREVMAYKYYRDSRGGSKEILSELLHKEKEVAHTKIPYFLSATSQHPGYFYIAYMPNQTPRFELFSVKPEGFKFRGHMFPVLDRMVGWFKEHYNDRSTLSIGGGHHNRSHHELHIQSPMVMRTPKMDEAFSLPIPYGGGP